MLVEGLHHFTSELERQFSNAALANARQVLTIPSVASGYDFSKIFDTGKSK